MVSYSFAYYFANVLATPISGLVIGLNLSQAYGSKASRRSRWSTHAVAFLCLVFIAIIVQQTCTATERESGLLIGSLKHPTLSQVLIPITIGCVEFIVQVYLVKLICKGLGKSALVILSISICSINFLISLGCAINISLALMDPNQAQLSLTETNLPSLNIWMPIFTAWLGSSTFSGLVIFGSQIYSMRQTGNLDRVLIVRFFRDDHTITKIGVITLQTAALNAVLLLVISLYFVTNVFTGDRPTPTKSGCFVFLNLMRVPVSCATWGFTMKRQDKLNVDDISMPLASPVNVNSMEDLSSKENKKKMFKNKVTVHTIRSQVYES